MTVTAIVPDGLEAGDTFLVRMPRIPPIQRGSEDVMHRDDQTKQQPTPSPVTENREDSLEKAPSLVDMIEEFITPKFPEEEEEEAAKKLTKSESQPPPTKEEKSKEQAPDKMLQLRESENKESSKASVKESTKKEKEGNSSPKGDKFQRPAKGGFERKESADEQEECDEEQDELASGAKKDTYEEERDEENEDDISLEDDSALPTQKLLLVQVPPGIPPGTTIHVEIPGEFRTLAAKVPPNVKSFHVAYTPQVKSQEAPVTGTHGRGKQASVKKPQPESKSREWQSQASSSRRSPSLSRGKPSGSVSHRSQLSTRDYSSQNQPGGMKESPPQIASSQIVKHYPTPPGQKLLLVRVPPGTPAGTTLHVSVPDEPGRILAAKVPFGGVREFHVSYESRSIMPSRSMLPPANAYANAGRQEPPSSPNSRAVTNYDDKNPNSMDIYWDTCDIAGSFEN